MEVASPLAKGPLGDTGKKIPALGLGLYYTPPGAATYDIVAEALKQGYRCVPHRSICIRCSTLRRSSLRGRHLDTAGFYENEEDVGRAVRDSGIPREQIHITSKVWPLEEGEWQTDGYKIVLEEVEKSFKKLGTYADLYLIHWPCNPGQRLNYWLALEVA